MRLCMGTGRTLLKSFFVRMEVTAVTASPGYLFVTLKHPACCNIGHQIQIAFFMLLLGYSNGFKYYGYVNKAFFTGSDSKTRVHNGVFIIFTACRFFQVFGSGCNLTGRKGSNYLNCPPFKELK